MPGSRTCQECPSAAPVGRAGRQPPSAALARRARPQGPPAAPGDSAPDRSRRAPPCPRGRIHEVCSTIPLRGSVEDRPGPVSKDTTARGSRHDGAGRHTAPSARARGGERLGRRGSARATRSGEERRGGTVAPTIGGTGRQRSDVPRHPGNDPSCLTPARFPFILCAVRSCSCRMRPAEPSSRGPVEPDRQGAPQNFRARHIAADADGPLASRALCPSAILCMLGPCAARRPWVLLF